MGYIELEKMCTMYDFSKEGGLKENDDNYNEVKDVPPYLIAHV